MLSAIQLREIFETKYERANWIKVLRENFEVKEIYATPKRIKLTTNDWAAEGFIIGRFVEKEGREIGIYEITINNKVKLERNKVGLRSLLKEVYENDVDAAFVVFDQKKKWRFSYVSEIRILNKDTNKREKKKTDPKRYTYLMGEGERCKTAADRFTRLYKSADLFGEGITLKAIEEAFSVEKLSKNFFEEYRKHYGYFTKYLTGKDENNKETGKPHAFLKSVFNGHEKDARDFIKKLMGRIVFLYFLEKKGWLGVPEDKNWGHGDENFLSNLFNDCKEQENFYQQVLVPLYFETLNEERPNDLFKIRASLFGKPGYNKLKIPYLNGGLFDNDEKHTDNLVFDKKLFADLFDFFDQYNFTIYEDSPDEHTVAVDPEMLGHIFENLLEDNKDKGAFYTPKEIVHYMCRESLIEYLYTKLNPQQTESYQEIGKSQTDMFGNKVKKGQLSIINEINGPKEIVKKETIEKFVLHHEAGEIIEHDETILKALKNVKICDPAIGSGAFPMGLLLEIFHLVETLFDIVPDTANKVWALGKSQLFNAAKVKEEIIQSSIYGVDIEKGAVDIARLRFWLSLIVDETTPRPLPNLDYKIVVGNSLLSKFETEVIDIDWNIKTKNASAVEKIINDQQVKLHLLETRQHLYFVAKGDKAKLQREIRDLKIDVLTNQLTLSKISFVENNPKLGGFAPTPKEIQKNLENEIKVAGFDKPIIKLKKLKEHKNAVLHFFDWKLDFPEVMNEKVAKGEAGFDIVIGNPPYIQLQKLGSYADELQNKKFETFARTGDIYCLFYEQGTNLLRSNGVLTYITSNKWMRAAYGELLRTYFIDKTNPLSLLDFGGFQVFDAATVDTNILVAQKAPFQNHVNTCVLGKDFSLNNISDYFRQHGKHSSFNSSSSWVVLSTIEQNIKTKIERAGIPLKEWDINIYRGILTGYNEAFIIDSATKDQLIAASPNSVEIIRPILRGRDIKKYTIKFADQWIINSHNGLKSKNIDRVDVKRDYPVVYTHLKEYEDSLQKRLDQGDHWTNLRNCAYLDNFGKEKIVWLELTDKLCSPDAPSLP